MCAVQISDVWRDAYHAPETSQFVVKIVQFDRPLGTQLGVLKKRAIPEELEDLIFGQGPEQASSVLPPMQTYALVDAAKVANLADIVRSSGLEHRCLFKGKLAEELGDVAPWLVKIEPDASFTRNLFTAGDMPSALWDKAPGVLIRSRASLAELWTYLRKFIKLQDESGKWFYFRYWEPRFLEMSGRIIDDLQGTIRRDAGYPLTVIAFQSAVRCD